jgi:hypothetical protein
MVKEDLNGGFGKQNERTAFDWCKENAKKHDSSVSLAEECANLFDFYLEDTGSIPERLYEVALKAIEEDLGDGFGRYMSGILNEERVRTKKLNARVENESVGQKRARLVQELPANRIKIRG